MSARERFGLTHRLIGGARRLLGVFLYLWILLTLFAVHESIVLAKRDIDYRGYWLALINAWILAKVMLVAEDLDLGGRWFQHRPVICQILSRAGVLALVFMAAHTVESVLIGLWHRRTIFESIPRIGGGSIADVLSVAVLLTVALIPFFAFRAIDQALGVGTLRSLLFARRSDIRAGETLSPR